jgi:hypothetical protein
MIKHYMVRISVVTTQANHHVIDVHISSKQADLSALLLELEQDPNIAAFGVYNTGEVPNTDSLVRLTQADFNSKPLAKLQ